MDLLHEIRAATSELSYPSETDAPVEATEFFRPFPWEDKRVTVSIQGATEFFAALRETDDAARFHALYGLLAGGLSGLTCYRVGEVRVAIYVVGEERETGRWLGISTLSVET